MPSSHQPLHTDGFWSIWQRPSAKAAHQRVGCGYVFGDEEQWYLHTDGNYPPIYVRPGFDEDPYRETEFRHDGAGSEAAWHARMEYTHDSEDDGSDGHACAPLEHKDAAFGEFIRVNRATLATPPTTDTGLIAGRPTVPPPSGSESGAQIDTGFMPIHHRGDTNKVLRGWVFAEPAGEPTSSYEYWMLFEDMASYDVVLGPSEDEISRADALAHFHATLPSGKAGIITICATRSYDFFNV